jgi:hypothetical protein
VTRILKVFGKGEMKATGNEKRDSSHWSGMGHSRGSQIRMSECLVLTLAEKQRHATFFFAVLGEEKVCPLAS